MDLDTLDLPLALLNNGFLLAALGLVLLWGFLLLLSVFVDLDTVFF